MNILLKYLKSSLDYLKEDDVNYCIVEGLIPRNELAHVLYLSNFFQTSPVCSGFHMHRCRIWLYSIHATEKPLFHDYWTPHIWQWSKSNNHVVSPHWLLAKEGKTEVGDRSRQLVFLLYSSAIPICILNMLFQRHSFSAWDYWAL